MTALIPGELNRFVRHATQLGRIWRVTDSRRATTVFGRDHAFLLDTVNTALGTAVGTKGVIGAWDCGR